MTGDDWKQFGNAVKAAYPYVFATLLRKFRRFTREDVQDCVQTAASELIAYVRRHDRIPPHGELRPLLLTAAINNAKDLANHRAMVRRNWTVPATGTGEEALEEPADGDGVAGIGAATDGPRDTAQEGRRLLALECVESTLDRFAAVSARNARKVRVFRMDYEGYSHEEIAEREGFASAHAARQEAYQVRRELRALLEPCRGLVWD
jgi:DNA-directed RNA polymerase specialized sigma24 family protein